MKWVLLTGILASALRAQTPVLNLIDPHPYHERELVRLELSGSGTREWQFTGFTLVPAGDCGTQEKPCFPLEMGLSPGEMGLHSPSSGPRTLALNHYIARLTPGHYRVAALARRMTITTEGGATYARYTEPAQYASSNPIEFDVFAATPAWERETVERCVRLLSAPPPANQEAEQAQAEAAQQLSWLDTPAARTAALQSLPRAEGLILAALRSSRDPAAVCELMQQRVPLPAQTVSTSYLYSLTETCAKVQLPAAPPSPAVASAMIRGSISTTPPKVQPAPVNPAFQAWAEKRNEFMEGLWARITAALAASLPGKEPEARITAMITLLERVNQIRANQPRQPVPAWLSDLSAVFVKTYPTVDVGRRQFLLDLFASALSGPSLIPLLESVLDSWKPGDYYEAVHSAIQWLHEIDPARAQKRILAELTNAQTWLDRPQLSLLPPDSVPPMDDALIAALAQAQQPGGWNPNVRMAAIALYATPGALPRLKAIYESQQGCQPELLAYFVRVEPAYADRVFRSHPWDMQAPPSVCTVQYFERIAPLAMSAGFEQYLTAYLMHSNVYVKTTAARVLGRYGTSTALPRLWETLRYFHDWWSGKDADLAQNGEGIALEVELRNAIARARNWVVGEQELRRIEGLCVSQWCRSETQQDLAALESPLRIDLAFGPRTPGGSVAQYRGLENLAAVEAKLAQFPRATRFTLVVRGGRSSALEESLRPFAAQHGLMIQ